MKLLAVAAVLSVVAWNAEATPCRRLAGPGPLLDDPISSDFHLSHPAVLSASDELVVAFSQVAATSSAAEDVYVVTVDTCTRRLESTSAGTKVNNYITSGQTHPQLVEVTNDVVVVWQSFDQDGSSWGVYARRLSDVGTATVEKKLNVVTSSGQLRPVVAPVTDYSTYFAVWQSSGQDGSNYGIFAGLFDASSTRIGNIQQVNTHFRLSQDSPSVASYHDIGESRSVILVVWQSYDQLNAGYDIFGQFYSVDSTGFEKIGSEFQVNEHIAGAQTAPNVAFVDEGGVAIVVWQSKVGDEETVQARYFAHGEGALTPEFRVSGTEPARRPKLGGFFGGAAVFWEQNDGIYGAGYYEGKLEAPPTLVQSRGDDGRITYHSLAIAVDREPLLLASCTGPDFTHQAICPLDFTEGLMETQATEIHSLERSDSPCGHRLGRDVAAIGDFNGDGYGDVAVLGEASGEASGGAYIVFGRIDMPTVEGGIARRRMSEPSAAEQLEEEGSERTLYYAGPSYSTTYVDSRNYTLPINTGYVPIAVAGAGDFNGDGLADVIISAVLSDLYDDNNPPSSAAFVVFGTSDDSIEALDTADLSNTNPESMTSTCGPNGIMIGGGFVGEIWAFGARVAGVGDFNGDGLDDVAVAAPGFGRYSSTQYNNFEGEGAVFIIFGTRDTTVTEINPFIAMQEGRGAWIMGEFASDALLAVAGAGDFNGDGIDDIILGADNRDANGVRDSGSAYIVFGSRNPPREPIDLRHISTRNQGIVLRGITEEADLGSAVAGIGDFNGDGRADVAVGMKDAVPSTSPRGADDVGEVYVVFGYDTQEGRSVDITDAVADGNGMVIYGNYSDGGFGSALASAGDFNGDGFADLLVGEPRYGNDHGAAHIIYGSAVPPAILNTHNLGSAGVSIIGYDYMSAGEAVSGGVDVNFDGYSDVIIGGPHFGDDYGAAYIAFGSSDPSSTMELGQDLNKR